MCSEERQIHFDTKFAQDILLNEPIHEFIFEHITLKTLQNIPLLVACSLSWKIPLRLSRATTDIIVVHSHYT